VQPSDIAHPEKVWRGWTRLCPVEKGKKHETGVIFNKGYVEKGCTKILLRQDIFSFC
jgi:hypothetical protein